MWSSVPLPVVGWPAPARKASCAPSILLFFSVSHKPKQQQISGFVSICSGSEMCLSASSLMQKSDPSWAMCGSLYSLLVVSPEQPLPGRPWGPQLWLCLPPCLSASSAPCRCSFCCLVLHTPFHPPHVYFHVLDVMSWVQDGVGEGQNWSLWPFFTKYINILQTYHHMIVSIIFFCFCISIVLFKVCRSILCFINNKTSFVVFLFWLYLKTYSSHF